MELIQHLQLIFGRSVTVRLRVLDHAFVPCIVGLLRPAIVLPKSLLGDMPLLKQIVTHEYAHIHRGDTWGLLWQQFVSAVFWWQPLLKLINRELSSARENIADVYVISQCDPINYAEGILRLAESVHASRSTALAFLSQPPTLEDRVRHVLTQEAKPEDKWQWICRCVSVALSAIVLFLCGGVAIQSKLTAQEPVGETKQIAAETNSPSLPTTIQNTSPITSTAIAETAPATSEAPAQTATSSTTQTTTQATTNDDDDLHLGPMIQDVEPGSLWGVCLHRRASP